MLSAQNQAETAALEPAIYRHRFSAQDIADSERYWRPICRYLQRWFPVDGTTLDVGAGSCQFINNIQSGMKIAVDLNEENLRRYANPEVRAVVGTGAQLDGIETGSVDAAFASNVYEHFQSREDVAASFREVRRVLRPGGRFVILQPNFACCSRRYFDFFDHRLIFTHRGMTEGLEIAGFEMEQALARFLPYTSKSRLPQAEWLVELYLRVPLAWRIMGQQMLLIAKKPG
ncbi:MAG TPA: class I SAM-dependent methyltransferase [Bryobacteraceae bacterium]|nr:class I SAM-dependent methyltransferase [Bryobacteraceae bacterium]